MIPCTPRFGSETPSYSGPSMAFLVTSVEFWFCLYGTSTAILIQPPTAPMVCTESTCARNCHPRCIPGTGVPLYHLFVQRCPSWRAILSTMRFMKILLWIWHKSLQRFHVFSDPTFRAASAPLPYHEGDSKPGTGKCQISLPGDQFFAVGAASSFR